MDPITASTAFATVVGLICNFRQEQSGKAALDHRSFMEWLEYHRHEDIKDLIATSHELQTEVDRVLQQGQEQILDQLAHANRLLAQLLLRVDGLSGIAQVFAAPPEFSEQAVSILEQLKQSGFPEVGVQKFIGGFRLVTFGFGSTGPAIAVSQPLFAEDDLNELARYGLLRLRISPEGTAFYGITRAATQLVQQIRPKQ